MSALNTIIDRIKANNKTLLIFDYDGTLTPIREKPELAKLDNETKNALEKLAKIDFIKIALVSGRSIKDLQNLTGINTSDISMYGIHGGEILKKGKIYVNIPESFKKDLNDLKQTITDLSDMPGIIIEDKKYSLSVHYRLADTKTAQIAVEKFKKQAEAKNLTNNFKFQEGRKVIELMPKNFNKGKAVNSLITKHLGYLPVYFGDDKTDIDAFKEIKKHNGLTFWIESDNSSNIPINTSSFPVDEIITIEKIKEIFLMFSSEI
ncbi:MAG: trehalose-phosphatase [bacterium]